MATQRLKFKSSLNGTGAIYRPFEVNTSQTIVEGDIVVLSSNKVSIAADAAAAGTVLGVAASSITTGGSVDSSDTIMVDVNPASIYRAGYTGSATPAVGNKYDMGAAAYQFDSDDTTGGWIQVVGNVDSTNKYADVILTNRVFGLA